MKLQMASFVLKRYLFRSSYVGNIENKNNNNNNNADAHAVVDSMMIKPINT